MNIPGQGRPTLLYEGITGDNGRVTVLAITNDNNDDGVVDGTTEEWTLEFENVAAFRKFCGKCRVGISGIRVFVLLDGKQVVE